MARVALLIPNFLLREQFGDISDPPIGVASIGGVLERRGHETLIVDGMAENLRDDDILKRVEEFRPRYIGIGCNYSVLHNPARQLARRLRDAFGKSVFIFVGGNHASAMGETLLRQAGDAFDAVAHGEGESVTPALVEALEAGEAVTSIPGLSVLLNGGVLRRPDLPLVADLDSLGMPAYHLLPMRCYQRYNIVSMRGCPYACDFCASTVLFSRKVRYRSPGSVVAEIEHLLNRYGDRLFWFSDDTFTVNRRHTEALLKTILDRGLRVRWSCLTTVNTVETDVLNLMRESGCRHISYGIETGHPAFFPFVGKPISREAVIRTSRLTRAAGLAHYGFFIFGFPGESWDTVADTYELIFRCELDGGGMNILIPLPGTALWKRLFDEQRLFRLDEMQWDKLFARLPNEAHECFPAQLASRWCKLSADELLEACVVGQRLVCRRKPPGP
ncbi:MAG: B12-binding domain-containing radical SAM protein [Lentisphaerae bacterium]|nr:B12-binding domain-containing radical SAM protein [Lentisphaerota bacterium]